jgi:hypothetical protein
MKLSSTLMLLAFMSNTNVGHSFVTPSVGRTSSTPLFFFGNKKTGPKKEDAAPMKDIKGKNKKIQPEPKKDELTQGQKLLRIAVTGSLDGVSLLGKPQHDWSAGYSKKGAMSPEQYSSGKGGLRKQNWLNK